MFGRPDTVAIKPVQGMASAGDEPPAVGEYAQKASVVCLPFPRALFYVHGGIDPGMAFLQALEAFNSFVAVCSFVLFT